LEGDFVKIGCANLGSKKYSWHGDKRGACSRRRRARGPRIAVEMQKSRISAAIAWSHAAFSRQ